MGSMKWAVHRPPFTVSTGACMGKDGSVFTAKSYTPLGKFAAPLANASAAPPSLLAFVATGKRPTWAPPARINAC